MKNKMMLMAYALGMVNEPKRSNNGTYHVGFGLGALNSDWGDYKLVHYYTDVKNEHVNDSYAIFYDGAFGCSSCCSCLAHIEGGFTLDHLCHLLTQTIDVHRSEINDK